MEQDKVENFILNNIKQEQPVEFVFILPNPELHASQNIKSEENEINQMKECTIRVEKFDRSWKNKPKMFSTKRFCESCKVVANSKALKHSTKCDRKTDEDSEDLKLFKCDLCPVMHKIKRLLRKHMKCHVKHRNFVCSDCDFGFKTVHGLLRHVRRQKALKCKVCEEKFKCAFALRKHEKLHPSSYKCDQCSYVGNTKQYLKFHKTTHTMPFKCETCDKNFSNKYYLRAHQINNKHGDFASAAVPKFSCNKCEFHASSVRGLYSHNHRAHAKSDVSCKVCSKVFKCRSYLWTHMTVHARASCHICNKEVSRRFLPQHIKEHFEGTEYNCDLCGGQFRKRNRIKQHMATIHPCREYVCILCRKKFKSINKLFDHKRIHVGKSDYRCPNCSFKSKSLFYLKRHLSTHH